MSILALSKIPLIALVCWGFTKCTTPPNPPPPKDAKSIKRRFEHDVYRYTVTIWAARLQDFVGFAEAATILACSYPDSKLSSVIYPIYMWVNGSKASKQATCSALTPSALQFAGGCLVVCGALIRVSTFAHMGKQFVFGAYIRKDHRLIKTGPYAVVRHPSYTGMSISHPGWLLWTFSGSNWLWVSGILGTMWGKGLAGAYVVVMILMPLYIVLSRMGVEDRFLREHFGREWDEWAEKVKYRLVPGIY